MHTTQSTQWKKQVLDELLEIFARLGVKCSKSEEALIANLYQREFGMLYQVIEKRYHYPEIVQESQSEQKKHYQSQAIRADEGVLDRVAKGRSMPGCASVVYES